MNKLPARRSQPDDVEESPTWRELRERAADLLKSLVREGKELERDLEPRVLPGLKALKSQLEKLIATLEERITRRS
jgi:flagellar biosynthesis chaperone FliJ